MQNRKIKIARAKRTKFGRFLCRILGEENGAVAMEYVIIGVLVAAAVVAIVMVFGDTIGDMFGTMIKAIIGDPEGAGDGREEQLITTKDAIKDADITGVKIQKGTSEGDGNSGGGGNNSGDID